MKSLQDILAEVQALATVSEDQFEASLATAVADLQAVIATPVTEPTDVTATVVLTIASGIVTGVTLQS